MVFLGKEWSRRGKRLFEHSWGRSVFRGVHGIAGSQRQEAPLASFLAVRILASTVPKTVPNGVLASGGGVRASCC
jgi:hypothetical protein